MINDLSNKYAIFAVIKDNNSPCPNCVLDPVNNISSGTYNGTGPSPFAGGTCPVCEGQYWIVTEVRRRIKATVDWGQVTDEQNERFISGELPRDFATVKAPLSFRPLMESTNEYIIDGDRCTKVGRLESRGLQSLAIVEMIVQRDL